MKKNKLLLLAMALTMSMGTTVFGEEQGVGIEDSVISADNMSVEIQERINDSGSMTVDRNYKIMTEYNNI